MDYHAADLDNREALPAQERRRIIDEPLSHAAQFIGYAKEGDDDEPIGPFIEEQLHEYLHEPHCR